MSTRLVCSKSIFIVVFDSPILKDPHVGVAFCKGRANRKRFKFSPSQYPRSRPLFQPPLSQLLCPCATTHLYLTHSLLSFPCSITIAQTHIPQDVFLVLVVFEISSFHAWHQVTSAVRIQSTQIIGRQVHHT